uniref:Uncharacterized protein n=1 Tax=Panagrolaimus sp. PS1159 TaxID=55785 RepID=A0AC35F3V2_9BILA
MVICVGYNPFDGNIKYCDSDFLTQPYYNVPKLEFRETEKIDSFFCAVKNKIVKPIDFFSVLFDSTYANDFRKKFVEIGHKYDIQNIYIVGTHQALFLKAVHDISVAINLDDVLWVFSLWKN